MAAEINITNNIEIVSFAVALVSVYVRMQVKQKEQEMKIIALEQRLAVQRWMIQQPMSGFIM